MDHPDILQRIEMLNQIGISLSAEKDPHKLLECILVSAQKITHADAGTVYLIDEERKHLRFAIMRNDSMGVAFGGSSGQPVPLAPVPLYHADGRPNMQNIAAYTALTGQPVNIPDAYTAEGFDFAGTKAYDQNTGYRSQSFLAIPMCDHENELIGVLQLINARHPVNGATIPFTSADQQLAESIASQAAVALTNDRLIGELRHLLEKFIEVIAEAIDEKSPYTGGHCRRVPEIAIRLAEAIDRTDSGPLAELKFTEEQHYELKIAALMHDCGKITTPVHVVDKATKLETIFDRRHLVDARFEILRRDAEIAYLRQRLEALEQGHPADPQAERHYHEQMEQLADEQAFIARVNLGGEFMQPADQARVETIARRQWRDHNGTLHPLLTEEEVYNLQVSRGTLTPEEREIINNHIVRTIKMLESLPFPRHLKNVPEIAGGHHERMDGKGYPRGLTREEMSVQARLMGIADIFEALTAADRPYKKPMTLSQALDILGKMKLDGHIDPDLFDIFVEQKVYLDYALKYLRPEQIDDVDPERITGYRVSPPAA